MPDCRIMVITMLGAEAEKEIIKIPLSDSTISRRIINISEDIEEQVIEVIKSGESFAMQVDESQILNYLGQQLVEMFLMS
ncbi:zinc finger BED domain-containing protein 5-like [Aphis craccivora]|uniref:Zinc finger BED domain-containing protein 5-like n=1 Tax=Aphis craccivora TaxID=307492 RepID=A0A6G0XZ31_APHCR|nr:zinc finger BED domain-containing protein 5-like [Aphis craccivora]